ncbi:porin family protein [Moraxella nasibovis]|uniref:porin family protein n=1 Tax=Moraxella nasibovis TaxID=2904120 RepID=UPI0024100C4D|nr:porin family protein [Moraxella nasibovis]WFF38933.1 porin family protein [Moraxella nasibovis]
MKTLNKAILALGASSILAMSANAAITYGSAAAGQPYVGVKVGQIDVDGLPSKATAYGVYGGYNFDQNFGAEVEYVGSETKGYSEGLANYEYDAKTYGAYGTYRYHFNNTPVYAKGKLGIAKTEVEDKGVNVNYTSSSDKTSLAGGVAVGFNATPNFGIEAGYNYLNADASMWGVGAHLKF